MLKDLNRHYYLCIPPQKMWTKQIWTSSQTRSDPRRVKAKVDPSRSLAMLLLSFMSSPCELSERQDSFLMFVSPSVSSFTQPCPTLCDPMDCSTPGLPVRHQLPELTQTHVHCVGDATQLSHPLLSPSPSALNLSQHQGLFQWVSSLYQVAKVLELQLQHQTFQWIFRTDFL